MIPAGVEVFTGVQEAASAAIMAAGSADLAGMTSAAATAIGPLGAVPYIAPYAGAQASNVAATMMVGGVHAGIGVASEASKVSTIATDALLG
jgi:hypothetical protein